MVSGMILKAGNWIRKLKVLQEGGVRLSKKPRNSLSEKRRHEVIAKTRLVNLVKMSNV